MLESKYTDDWRRMALTMSGFRERMGDLSEIRNYISLYEASSITCRNKKNHAFVDNLSSMVFGAATYIDREKTQSAFAAKYRQEDGHYAESKIYKQEIEVLEKFLFVTQKEWEIILKENPWLLKTFDERLY